MQSVCTIQNSSITASLPASKKLSNRHKLWRLSMSSEQYQRWLVSVISQSTVSSTKICRAARAPSRQWHTQLLWSSPCRSLRLTILVMTISSLPSAIFWPLSDPTRLLIWLTNSMSNSFLQTRWVTFKLRSTKFKHKMFQKLIVIMPMKRHWSNKLKKKKKKSSHLNSNQV